MHKNEWLTRSKEVDALPLSVEEVAGNAICVEKLPVEAEQFLLASIRTTDLIGGALDCNPTCDLLVDDKRNGNGLCEEVIVVEGGHVEATLDGNDDLWDKIMGIELLGEE